MNNKPSQSSVSDLLNTLHAFNEEINDTILIGEKVAMIEESAQIFHQIKAIITPDYLTDDEFKWIEGVATSWNNEVLTYRRAQSNDNADADADANVASKPNVSPQKKLEDIFNDALNDMISNGDFDDTIENLFDDDSEQDNGGFDGGDGVW